MSPKYYSHDGISMGSAGSGADGKTLIISFKSWNYSLTTDGNENGNQVMEWQDDQGGTYMATSFRAVKVLSTFYIK